jgi:hypothetical protein
MEKQLLSLLDWEVTITETDLYRELDFFLSPIRLNIEEVQKKSRHAKKVNHPEPPAHATNTLSPALLSPLPVSEPYSLESSTVSRIGLDGIPTSFVVNNGYRSDPFEYFLEGQMSWQANVSMVGPRRAPRRVVWPVELPVEANSLWEIEGCNKSFRRRDLDQTRQVDNIHEQRDAGLR